MTTDVQLMTLWGDLFGFQQQQVNGHRRIEKIENILSILTMNNSFFVPIGMVP